MRLLDTIKSAADYLEKSGVEDFLVDSELLVLYSAGIDRLRAYLDNPEADRRVLARINRLTKRRASGEPLQYIIGHVDFLGLRIRVGKGVLIPRPETELLVQEAISEMQRQGAESGKSKRTAGMDPSLRILDLCTGSGCIALALAQEFPSAHLYATDVSAKAIKYAKGNAEMNGIENVIFLKGTLFASLQGNLCFDLITANPPYIRTADISGLQREIREWEPVKALNGGEDGLDFYRLILSQAAGYLKKNGCLLFELGVGQSGAVAEIARSYGFKYISIKKDFAGIERILKAEI